MVERSAQYVKTIVYSDARCELCKSDYPYEVTGPDKQVYKLIEYQTQAAYHSLVLESQSS